MLSVFIVIKTVGYQLWVCQVRALGWGEACGAAGVHGGGLRARPAYMIVWPSLLFGVAVCFALVCGVHVTVDLGVETPAGNAGTLSPPVWLCWVANKSSHSLTAGN